MRGGQSVTIFLEERMLELCANSWKGSREMVSTSNRPCFKNPSVVNFNCIRSTDPGNGLIFIVLCQKRLRWSLYVCAYNSGAVAFPGAQFNPGTGPIFLDQIVCSGSETSVLDCRRHTPLGLPTCEHSQDAGVRCIGMYGTAGV